MKYINQSRKLYITFERTFSFFLIYSYAYTVQKIPSNYKKNNSKYVKTDLSSFNLLHMNYSFFTARATKPKEFLVFPNEVEENQTITIKCIADVGSPHGYIQIWKKTEKSNTSDVIYKSSTTNGKTENCTEIINVTTTYIMTMEDNGALFRCSSKNDFTKDPIPSGDSSKISVHCM